MSLKEIKWRIIGHGIDGTIFVRDCWCIDLCEVFFLLVANTTQFEKQYISPAHIQQGMNREKTVRSGTNGKTDKGKPFNFHPLQHLFQVIMALI